jgi:hypothetical protein
MKYYTAALAGLLLAGAVQAQTPLVLIEACNAVPAADKRLECLKAAMGATAVAPQAAAIDTLEQAFASMRAGLGVGLSYNDYQSSVVTLARALAVYQQQGSALPSTALEEALEAYKDAGIVWGRSIEFYAHSDNVRTYPNAPPVSRTGLEAIAFKYKLPLVNSNFLGWEKGVPVEFARSSLWGIALVKAKQGFLEIRDPHPTPKPPPVSPAQEADIAAANALAKEQQCQENPQVERTGLAGVDTLFAAACTNGKQLNIACASGICRVMAQPIP